MVSGRNLGQGGKFRGGESLRNVVSRAREKTKGSDVAKSRHSPFGGRISPVCLLPFPEYLAWVARHGL